MGFKWEKTKKVKYCGAEQKFAGADQKIYGLEQIFSGRARGYPARDYVNNIYWTAHYYLIPRNVKAYALVVVQ